jgi:chromosome segregation ATPase
MVGRVGISYEDVVQSAIALLGRGQNPSVQKVRELLGTGSNSTITAHLKRWQQELADRPRSILPPTIPESVSPVFEQCWQLALDAADQCYNQLKEQAQREVTIARQARDAALLEQRTAAGEAESLQRQIAVLNIEHQRLQTQFLEEKERCRTAERALLVTEKRVADAHETVEQIRRETASRVAATEQLRKREQDESNARLSEISKRLEYERERSEASEARLYAVLDQARGELRQERGQRETERRAWQATEANYREQATALGQELQKAQSSKTLLDNRINGLTADCDELKKKLLNRENRLRRLTRLVNALRIHLTEARAGNESLSQRLEDSQAYAQSLTSSLRLQRRGEETNDKE